MQGVGRLIWFDAFAGRAVHSSMTAHHEKHKHKQKHPHAGEPVPMVKTRSTLATVLAACLLVFGVLLVLAFVLWMLFG